MQISESDAFKANKKNSLNNLANSPDSWTLDVKYFQKAYDEIEKVKFGLEDGIILRMQVERLKYLEQQIIKNCYQNKTYTFMQAQKCEQFHIQNDFKLNLLKNFFNDHIVKHINEYQMCF